MNRFPSSLRTFFAVSPGRRIAVLPQIAASPLLRFSASACSGPPLSLLYLCLVLVNKLVESISLPWLVTSVYDDLSDLFN